MNQAEAPRVLQIRERLGKPSLEEETDIMNQFYPQVHEAILRGFSQVDVTLKLLSMIRGAEKEARANPSRPRLCADSVMMAPFPRYTNWAIAANNLPQVRFNYDLGCGVNNTIALLHLAEDELTGSGEAITDHLRTQKKYDPQARYSTPSDSYAETKSSALEVAQLLRKDPTGLMVLEYGIESLLNEEPWTPSWQSRTYVVAGAELARDAYKVLYEVSSRLV